MENKFPKVTIITPTLNSEKDMESCILSVANQTYKNKEHLIMDGLSKDNTLKIVRKLAKKYPHIKLISKKDDGIYDAMNKGIDVATGEWIYFLGSDDIFYENNVLERIFKNMDLNPFDVVYGNVKWGDTEKIYDGRFTAFKLLEKNICHQALFTKKSLFKKIGKFNLKYKILADKEFNYRWFSDNSVKRQFVDITIAKFGISGKSCTEYDTDFKKDRERLVELYFSEDNVELDKKLREMTRKNEESEKLINEMNKKFREMTRKNEALEKLIKAKEEKINFVKSSKFWRLRKRYLKLKELKISYVVEMSKKAKGVLNKDGFFIFFNCLSKYFIYGREYFKSGVPFSMQNYDLWIKKNENWDKSKIKKEIEDFKYKPRISIVVPTYDADLGSIDRCVLSVKNQFYQNWELCLQHKPGKKSENKDYLRKYESADTRIKVVDYNIYKDVNDALRMAVGEFVAFLAASDEISPNALYEVVKLINKHPEADLIYSDEDSVDYLGNRSNHFFKPNWSPELFYSMNYIHNFSVIRKRIGDEVGWFRKEYEGAREFDLFLRLTAKTKKIAHIPKILYHRRVMNTALAKSIKQKNQTSNYKIKALQDFFKSNNIKARVEKETGKEGYYIKYDLPDNALVSIIIPFKDRAELLKKCVESIESKTTYKKYEIILVSNNSSEKETFDYFETLKKYENVRVFEKNIKFNFSILNNWAVKQARGNFIVFLNNDTEIITPQWIEEMLMHANREEVGAVGALLFYPDNVIQHAGVIVGIGGTAGHIFSKQKLNETYHNLANYTRNYLAVTAACMMISKEKFLEVGGFNESFTVCGNDVDLCLKLYEKGCLNVFTPHAKILHHESVSRERTPPECDVKISKKRYAPYIGNDPYYNENLSLKDGTTEISIIN